MLFYWARHQRRVSVRENKVRKVHNSSWATYLDPQGSLWHRGSPRIGALRFAASLADDFGLYGEQVLAGKILLPMPATVLSLGWAGARHPSYAKLARATPRQHRMGLGWCQEHLGPPPRAAPARAPQWRLSPLGGGAACVHACFN